jgi:GNAT superfamily N-acetyltransferase
MMSAELVLRQLALEEVGVVARLWWRSSISVAAGADHPPWEALAERLIHEPWAVTLAIRGGEPVGLLAVETDQHWLRQLFVDPDAQGCGVGSTLLGAAKRQMPEGFHLNTDAGNSRARRFYEARGLRLVGEAPHPRWGQLQARYEWSPVG